MSTLDLLKQASVVAHRLPWMAKGSPEMIGIRVHGVDDGMILAASLDKQAADRGLRIVEVVKVNSQGQDVVFARGVK